MSLQLRIGFLTLRSHAFWQGRPSCLSHPAFVDHFAGAFHVHFGPKGFLPARGEALGKTLIVHAFFEAVDPAKANGFLHCVRVGNGWLLRKLFILDQPDLFFDLVILFEPFAKLFAGGQVNCFADFHICLQTCEFFKNSQVSLYKQKRLST